MEIKYCVRCGASLGYARANKKYCSACKRKVEYQSYKAKKENGEIGKLRVINCEWCGKPLVQKTANQKYHAECAYFSRLDKSKKTNAKNYAEKKKQKKKLKKPEKKKVLSVSQVQHIACKLGLSYGTTSLKLSTGEISEEEYE